MPNIPSQSSQNSSIPTALAEINVTPLVDVMLVLLIVFMISAPLMQQGVQVDLPKADAGTLSEAPEQVLLVITDSQKIMMNGTMIQKGTLLKRLTAISSINPEVQVFVQSDKDVSYGFVTKVVAEVKRANITKVGLVTQPDDAPERL